MRGSRGKVGIPFSRDHGIELNQFAKGRLLFRKGRNPANYSVKNCTIQGILEKTASTLWFLGAALCFCAASDFRVTFILSAAFYLRAIELTETGEYQSVASYGILFDAGAWGMPKILLVEDNEMNRDMLSRRLERKGMQVVIAVDGEQGVAMAQTETPDLILMDMSLPVLDGWSATRRLKTSPATQRIPIIALTAHAMSGDRDKCMEAGCDDYDTKPVEFTRLMSKIQTLLASSSAASSSLP